MDPQFMRPAAAEAPVVLGGRVERPQARKRLKQAGELLKGVVYYGLLLFGSLFPVVATIYAVIVY